MIDLKCLLTRVGGAENFTIALYEHNLWQFIVVVIKAHKGFGTSAIKHPLQSRCFIWIRLQVTHSSRL